MMHNTAVHKIELSETESILVEAISLGGEEDVALKNMSFDRVFATVAEFSQRITELFRNATLHQGTVEFSIKLGVESGKLTSLIASGSSEANLKVTLQWRPKPHQPGVPESAEA